MKKIITASVVITLFVFTGFVINQHLEVFQFSQNEKSESLRPVKNPTIINKETTQKDRSEYFFRMLRNPVTNQIPPNIQLKEVEFLEDLKLDQENRLKAVNDPFEWKEVGPNDVGGRTRAIAFDSRDSNILIAGGASGGIWKSINGGVTWVKKSDISGHLGVTALVQHPTTPDVWYYSTGEFFGSAGADGAPFFGSGIFKSTDNGETWSQVQNTADTDVAFNSQYDFISNIVISPTTGTIFFAASPFGIFRTTNDFVSVDYVLGVVNNHDWADVAVNSDGDVIGVLSSGSGSDFSPGVYISTNDGATLTWTNVTPGSYPNNPDRGVIGVSVSDPDVFYVFTDTGIGAEGLTLHRFDISNPNSVVTSDRSSGIPNFKGDVGDLNPQGGYNLVCKVHPSNSNIVFVGGTNLFRSTDGFSSVPPNTNGTTNAGEAPKYWIGGYDIANDISQYPSHHPDQHNLIFYPENPNRAISAHDGGLSRTENITANSVTWTDIDNGYNVTQFYKLSIHPGNDDSRIMGGTQDNGSPYFFFDFEAASSNSVDISSGDGATAFLGNNYLITSSQNGFLLRYDYSGTNPINFSYITPLLATDQQFIHPFTVNPSDENYLFYPEFDHLWKNDQMITLPRNTSNTDGTNQGWSELNSVNTGTDNHEITALTFSTTNPPNRLYFGGSDVVEQSAAPVIRRFDNIDANDGETSINITGSDPGSFVNDISVNPDNGNEVIAVMSNYSVKSIWHTSNGGTSWTDIEGNLGGENGPSIRTAAIASTDQEGTYYFVGTSIGLFYTDQLNGSSTVWTQVAEDLIENAIVSELDYRRSDHILAVATHGRGLFVGKVSTMVSNEFEPTTESPNTFELQQNYPNPFNPSTNIEFTLASNSSVSLTIFDINGREVAKIFDQQIINSGAHTSSFDASALASGTYIYRLEASPINGGSPFTQSRTMTLIK